jgi:hypothetical protein
MKLGIFSALVIVIFSFGLNGCNDIKPKDNIKTEPTHIVSKQAQSVSNQSQDPNKKPPQLNNTSIPINGEVVTQEKALEIISKWCERPDGNNGTAESIPEYDKVKNGIRYYYFNVVFASGSAAQFFVDSKKGDIYASDADKDVIIDGKPLNERYKHYQ